SLADGPQATLYQHPGLLTRGGILRIVEERPVRGTVEKVYALASDAHVAEGDLADATPEDHMRYFTAFVAGLLADFARYLRRDVIHLAADGVGYHQTVLYLSDEELKQFGEALSGVLLPLLAHEPKPGRERRLLSIILMPDDEV